MLKHVFKKQNLLASLRCQLRPTSRQTLCIPSIRKQINQRTIFSNYFLNSHAKSAFLFCSNQQNNNIKDQTFQTQPLTKVMIQKNPLKKSIEETARIFNEQLFTKEKYSQLSQFITNINKPDVIQKDDQGNEIDTQIVLPLDEFKKQYTGILTQKRFKKTSLLFETQQRKKYIRNILNECTQYQKQKFMIEGPKGVGKSHLLLLLFFVFSQHSNFRVLYLNETSLFFDKDIYETLLLTLIMMTSRDLDKKIYPESNETIAEILKELNVQLKSKQFNKEQFMQQIMEFLRSYRIKLQEEDIKIAIIIDQKNQLNKQAEKDFPNANQMFKELQSAFNFKFFGTSYTDATLEYYNPQDYYIIKYDPQMTDKEKLKICKSFFKNIIGKDQLIDWILLQLDYDPFLVGEFLEYLETDINNYLADKDLINGEINTELKNKLDSFSIQIRQQIVNDIEKQFIEKPENKSQILEEMSKVAALIDSEIKQSDQQKSDAIKFKFVDKRFVIQRNYQYIGINKFASDVIKEYYFNIDYNLKWLSQNINNKGQESQWGSIFHSYFLNQINNAQVQNISFTLNSVNLKNLNLADLTKQNIKQKTKQVTIDFPKITFETLKIAFLKDKLSFFCSNIFNESPEQQMSHFFKLNENSPVVDFIILQNKDIYFFQIKTGSQRRADLINKKSKYLEKLNEFTNLFEQNLKRSSQNNFTYHFAFIIFETSKKQDKSNAQEKNNQFLADFLSQNKQNESSEVHKQLKSLMDSKLIESIGVLDYVDLCQQLNNKGVQLENFQKYIKY